RARPWLARSRPITRLSRMFEDYLGGDSRDELVRSKLVASLYAQPASLAFGALAGSATAITAAVVSGHPLIGWCAALLILVAIARVIAAFWLRRDSETGPRDVHVLEIAFEAGALAFALLAGILGAL